MGIGRMAKIRSVSMLTMLLKRPMEEKVLAEKHRVEGRSWSEWFQLADTGVQLKIRVPAQAIMKHTRKTSIQRPLALSSFVPDMAPNDFHLLAFTYQSHPKDISSIPA